MSNSTAADRFQTSRQTRRTARGVKEVARDTFSCDIIRCKYTTSERRRMLMHIMRAHTKDKPFACSQCNYRTANHQRFRRHLQSHTVDELLECNVCDFTTTQPQVLDHHLRLHTKEKPYACDSCAYMTTQLSELMLHTQTHNVDRMFICDVCDCNTATLKSLTEGKKKGCRLCRIHSCACFVKMTVHLCVHCQKSCVERWSYRRATIHFSLPSRIHYNYVKGVLTCNLCERIFKAKKGYISHMKSHIRKRKLLAIAETQKIITPQMGKRYNLHDLTM